MAHKREHAGERGRKPAHLVYALLDSAGAVGAVGVRRADVPGVGSILWTVKDQVAGRLGEWLRSLPSVPREDVVIGAMIGLHRTTAADIASALAAWWGCPVVGEGRTPGRRRLTAGVGLDGTITVWNGQSSAGAAHGLTRWGARRLIRAGRAVDLGPTVARNLSNRAM